MPRTQGTPQTFARDEDCCCTGTGTDDACHPCPVEITNLTNITVNSASGNVARYFVEGLSGVSGVGTTGPYDSLNPMEDLSIDYVGQVGIFSLLARCQDDQICLEYRNTSMTFGSGDTIPEYIGSTCDVGTGSSTALIHVGTVVCDLSGFVSVDFSVDLGADGYFEGTVYR